jgi:O-antigen ligase
VFASRVLAETTRQRAIVLITTAVLVLAQALTAGRAGYATSAAVCLVLCLIKWRRYLLLAPVMALVVLTIAPGVAQRFTEGFSADTEAVPARIRQLRGDQAETSGPDIYTITAGRNVIWPFVIAKITQSPWVGYGRLAMVRTGLTSYLSSELDEGFSHPHNAYLEWLLDNGIIGFVLVMPFYLLILWYAYDLFLDRRAMVLEGIGGATLAFVLALMIASMGSQSFYPREGWVGMWCLIFLMLRVRAQRDAALAAVTIATSGETSPVAARRWAIGPPPRQPRPAIAAVAAAPRHPASVIRTERPRLGLRARLAATTTLTDDQLWPAIVPPPTRIRSGGARVIRVATVPRRAS